MMPQSIFRSWKSKIFFDEILHAPQVYTDSELKRIKEAGHSGIWLAGILREISYSDIFTEFNQEKNKQRQKALNILIQRAKKYDLNVFVYLVEPRNLNVSDPFWKKYPEIKGTFGTAGVIEYENGYAMCTSDKRVIDFLENSTANLFKMVPELKGLILVTASEHMHHCLSFATPVWPEIYRKQYPDLCPRCRDKSPVGIVSEIINAIARGAFSVKTDAEIIASVWGWTWYEELPHSKIIDTLDFRIAVESFFEKGGVKKEKSGRQIRINEYALSYVGPSKYNQKLFSFLKKRNRRFYIRLVLGTTHELITVPCIPVPTQVYKKVIRAIRLKPYGYMSFTFGTMPCINLKVFEKILKMKTLPKNQRKFLKELAEEYFPGCNPEMVYKSWLYFASALNLYPFSNALMYYGPICYALAYKQYPGPVKGEKMNPTWLPLPRDGDDLSSVCKDYDEKTIIQRFEKMSEHWQKGLTYYRKALENVPNEKKNNELSVAEIIPLIFSSVAHIFEIHLLKKNWQPENIKPFLQTMRKELEICQQALPLVKSNKLLGYHIEAGMHLFSAKLIKGKIRHIKNLLRTNKILNNY